MSLLQNLDQLALQQHGGNDQIESAISNYELAFRMQTAVPDLMNITNETPATREMTNHFDLMGSRNAPFAIVFL